MIQSFKKANGPLQIFIVFVSLLGITVGYAGNWITFGIKTALYAAIVIFLSFLASNIGVAEGEKTNYRPYNSGQYISVMICVLTFIVAAAVKHYELTQ